MHLVTGGGGGFVGGTNPRILKRILLNVMKLMWIFLKNCACYLSDSHMLFLKEQCHEDFALLGQFCAKIIALRLKS